MNGATDRDRFDQANEHCVEQLMRASATRELVASDDICDARGFKLWGKGQPINASLRERLVARRLLKPIESCLQFSDSIVGSDFARMAQSALDAHAPIAQLVGGHSARLLSLITHSRLSGPPQLMLSTAATNDSSMLEHTSIVALLAGALTLTLHGSDALAMDAIHAALAHDVGELYIDPALLKKSQRLSYPEWRAVVVHPIIGSTLLRELGGFPPPVARAVLEHHERMDGTGYPAGTAGDAISPLGRILMVAELLAAILPGHENPGVRAMLALRLIPDQFPRDVTSIAARVFRCQIDALPTGFDPATLKDRARSLLNTLDRGRVVAGELETHGGLSQPQRDLARRVRLRTVQVEMALHATGALAALDADDRTFVEEPAIANELQIVISELLWRVRDFARHVELSASHLQQDIGALRGLVETFDMNADPSGESLGTADAAPERPIAAAG